MSTSAKGPVIQNFRISFIWCEAFFVDNDHPVIPLNSPFSFLGDFSSYDDTFKQIKNSRDGLLKNLNISLPWERKESNKPIFWTDYTLGERYELRNLTSADAWKNLVPFRAATPPFDIIPWLPPRFALEIFYYPHGFACVLTAYYEGQFSLGEVVDKSLALRQEKKGGFTLQGSSGALSSSSFDILDNLAEEVMDILHQQTVGPNAQLGSRTPSPFTIITFLQGDGVPLDSPPSKKIHQALEALTNWNPRYKHYNPVPLEQANLLYQQPEVPPSHVFYMMQRGRTVWYPVDFSPGQGNYLSQIHRELVLLTMQVESLCSFLTQCEQQYPALKLITDFPNLRVGAHLCHAVDILGRLYGGGRFTYSTKYGTPSIQAQLEHNDMIRTINYWRDICDRGREKLFKKISSQ